MANIVAIVGRPNVGKSTLFNRLIQKRQAIVDDKSGVTRDRHYGKSEWIGKEFTVIDTGGYIVGSDDTFEVEIRKQVELAIDEANVILFVVDNQVGLTDMDKEVANLLRKTQKPVLLVVNKVDTNKNLDDSYEFYNLGFESFFTISSISGSGTGELLDEAVRHFDDTEYEDLFEGLPRIA
ncbi:MAG: 50S ribosome-binding GTPase, partial [Weeksellaceae bacterium]|nr:50S ribosome-binding GTPase [Weeksellaceae bacterium]